jgi:hypothetical protein
MPPPQAGHAPRRAAPRRRAARSPPIRFRNHSPHSDPRANPNGAAACGTLPLPRPRPSPGPASVGRAAPRTAVRPACAAKRAARPAPRRPIRTSVAAGQCEPHSQCGGTPLMRGEQGRGAAAQAPRRDGGGWRASARQSCAPRARARMAARRGPPPAEPSRHAARRAGLGAIPRTCAPTKVFLDAPPAPTPRLGLHTSPRAPPPRAVRARPPRPGARSPFGTVEGVRINARNAFMRRGAPCHPHLLGRTSRAGSLESPPPPARPTPRPSDRLSSQDAGGSARRVARPVY